MRAYTVRFVAKIFMKIFGGDGWVVTKALKSKIQAKRVKKVTKWIMTYLKH